MVRNYILDKGKTKEESDHRHKWKDSEGSSYLPQHVIKDVAINKVA
jgi:hypothetical protein